MPRIATLGPEGSFSEEAAAEYGKRFRESKILLMDDPEDIIGLARGADLGLLAIENSLEGSIALTLDLMREMKSVICDEVVLRIRHSLVGNSDLRSVVKVFSHPAAIAQCRRFLKRELPHAELVVASSTAQGAKLASAEPRSAAIASVRAARIYGLRAIAEDIQDQETYTRFIVVGKSMPGPSGRDKTSLIIVVKDSSGALYRALEPFARRGINLTKIESRPSKRALGEYVFFTDFDGHVSDPGSEKALAELSRVCVSLKVLGSYPAATFPQPPAP